MADACRFGNILGAMVASREGATAIISDQDIEDFKNQELEVTIEEQLQQYIP